MKSALRIINAGTIRYAAATELQHRLHRKRLDGNIGDIALFVEHPHVYTLGRRFQKQHLLFDEAELTRRGIELHQTDRGGSITYHGPGQLVVYPIVRLARSETGLPDVVRYLRRLEEAIIQTASHFGVEAGRRPGFTGVWAGGDKLAAIGVKVARGVTTHGLALNVSTDLDYFKGMVACGIEGAAPTSMEKLLGRRVLAEEVAGVLADKVAAVLGLTPVESSLDELGVRASPTGPATAKERRPQWLKTRLRTGPNFVELKQTVKGLQLNTVCEEAKCPNIYECWEAREATFLILGNKCTRRCGFCDIATGKPGALDYAEPGRVALAVEKMGLNFAVVTGVERDDVAPAQVAQIWAATISAIRERVPGCGVEVLTGDLKGDPEALEIVLNAAPSVFAHNLETVERLHRAIRPGFRYERSLGVLAAAKRIAPAIPSKSNLILGLGERPDEVIAAMNDLRSAGVDLLTIGQYLSPSAEDHARVHRWVTPEEFAGYRSAGEALGFAWVESGPLVRSSYHAGRQYRAAADRLRRTTPAFSAGP